MMVVPVMRIIHAIILQRVVVVISMAARMLTIIWTTSARCLPIVRQREGTIFQTIVVISMVAMVMTIILMTSTRCL